MRNLIPLLGLLAMAVVAFADPYTEITPDLGLSAPPPTDPFFDLLWYTNVQTSISSQLLLSACYAEGFFFICGSGLSPTDPADNKIYKLDSQGNLLTTYNQPNVNSGWGFRDLCYDGTYLYAGCEAAEIYAFDLNGNMISALNIPKPQGCSNVRALAYDPATDHFWTGNFAADIYEFDRDGTVIWSGSTGLAGIYGMAWDAVSAGGPFLWIYDQSGSPATTMKKVSGVSGPVPAPMIVGSYQLPNPPGLTAGTAGGCEATTEWGTSRIPLAMVALDQGTPNDNVLVYEVVDSALTQPNITIENYPDNPPVIIPPAGGAFTYTVIITNHETTTQTFQVWVIATLPNGTEITVIQPITVTLPGGVTLTRGRTQVVPASAPWGSYDYC